MSQAKISAMFPSVVSRRAKRVGRGHGSGKVKTAGRGTKGQNARGRMPVGFEGGQLPLVKRLPLLRGKGKNKSFKDKNDVISFDVLLKLPDKTEVSINSLKKHGLIGEKVVAVKLLASGNPPNRVYKVLIPCSSTARKAIEKAGGLVVQPK
jgi:large subunit ribosomal protein L15